MGEPDMSSQLSDQINEVYERHWRKMSPAADRQRATAIREILSRPNLAESDRRLCEAELRAIGRREILRQRDKAS